MIISGYENVKNVHLIGIGGVSMSAIAQMLKINGYNVTGSDIMPSEQTEILLREGIEVKIGNHPEMVKNAELVIYTAAIKETDPEYQMAESLNIPKIERAIFIGILTKQYKNSIAISGTHGKTTTTSLISNAFLEAQLDPTIQVGAYLKDINGNYKIGNSNYFIFESCEYKDSFLKFYPYVDVILNIDKDHLDYFENMDSIISSFEKSTDNIDENGYLVINADDENSKRVVEYVNRKNEENGRNIKIITFGKKENNNDADYQLISSSFYETTSKFKVLEKKTGIETTVNLNVLGLHNVLNALAAFAVGRIFEIEESVLAKGLERFTGASRRFEYKGRVNGAKIYDDYAHHPTEIMALANSVSKLQHNNIYAIFEPHTYTRTMALKDEFADALALFDNIIVTKIYAAREVDTNEISGQDIVNILLEKNKNAMYIEKFRDIEKYIKKTVEKGDIVLTVGAGTITNLGTILSEDKGINNHEITIVK